MTTSENEEILLTSDDKTLTLTNQRVIYKTSEVSQEILLKDVAGHEIIQVKEKFFLWLGLATVALIFYLFKDRGTYDQYHRNPHSYSTLILIILALIFFYCYNSRPKKLLKITGRYNTIEIPIKNVNQNNVNTFLNKLSVESENRKKEKE